MKYFITFTVILHVAIGLNIFVRSDNICAGVDNGERIPNDNDCNSFTLCDQGNALTLKCRSSHPHFYRCNSTCVNDITVCDIRDCPNSPTTTEQTTTITSLPITTAETTKRPDDPTTTQSGPTIPTAPGDGTTTESDVTTPPTTTAKYPSIPTAPIETTSNIPTTTTGGYTGIPTAPIETTVGSEKVAVLC